ncbi:phosphoribosylformylglycinamidine cyclo-ligase [Anaerosphaera aminiphila DSM 21120]|uniref:Phosphoribosylformylglycinamidine cyclo-ligase n=1 Tax=Anaerosphaera aminiphila DSM 21120 TaxID=1120995 RepID=A0A1M5RW99_9FIRM|nr:phosphoribosylformylglycinamidine cyclo-ligase [Anaerosphaera aminiphila]SHH30535.1 phosphoribosylformylglycinamidine cyclo-ligase [Anaerosphaera aminiphila DSM 21120]
MIDYKDSGVDIDSGNRAVELMKAHVKKTYTSGVFGDIGLFSGGFSLREFKDMEDPILLASTDGVGTKLLIAQKMDSHTTIGIDLVAMCVNDLICQGAKPLFFLDYIGADKIVPERIEKIVEGVSNGCIESGCALIGGETAELPGMYAKDEYDLAGFSVGIVDRKNIIDGQKIKEGNTIIALQSSGLHSNGYSLARKLFLEELAMDLNETFPNSDKSVGEVLLTPTKLYVKTIMYLVERHNILGIANITGGGLVENVPRILPEGLTAEMRESSWEKPIVFDEIIKSNLVKRDELFRAFNMGVGMVLIVENEKAEEILKDINENTDDRAFIIGEIVKGEDVKIL